LTGGIWKYLYIIQVSAYKTKTISTTKDEKNEAIHRFLSPHYPIQPFHHSGPPHRRRPSGLPP